MTFKCNTSDGVWTRTIDPTHSETIEVNSEDASTGAFTGTYTATGEQPKQIKGQCLAKGMVIFLPKSNPQVVIWAEFSPDYRTATGKRIDFGNPGVAAVSEDWVATKPITLFEEPSETPAESKQQPPPERSADESASDQ